MIGHTLTSKHVQRSSSCLFSFLTQFQNNIHDTTCLFLVVFACSVDICHSAFSFVFFANVLNKHFCSVSIFPHFIFVKNPTATSLVHSSSQSSRYSRYQQTMSSEYVQRVLCITEKRSFVCYQLRHSLQEMAIWALRLIRPRWKEVNVTTESNATTHWTRLLKEILWKFQRFWSLSGMISLYQVKPHRRSSRSINEIVSAISVTWCEH